MSDPQSLAVAPPPASVDPDLGKNLSLVIYVLYLVCLPTGGLSVLIGGIMAYAARGTAAPWVRSHFDLQVKLFWQSLIGAVVIGVLSLLSVPLMLILIGFVLLKIVAILWLALVAWVMIRSVLGLINLTSGRPA